MGILLLHERMLESFVKARQKHLKPGGLMLPTQGTIYVCPFTDPYLYQEQVVKGNFFSNSNFYGLDIRCLHQAAVEEALAQPVVGPVPLSSLLAHETASSSITLDFRAESDEDLKEVDIPFHCVITQNGTLHGIATWFDVNFMGEGLEAKDSRTSSTSPSTTTGPPYRSTYVKPPVVLTTAPSAPLTHWYQTRLLFPNPLQVQRGQALVGKLRMVANDKSSFNLTLSARLTTPVVSDDSLFEDDSVSFGEGANLTKQNHSSFAASSTSSASSAAGELINQRYQLQNVLFRLSPTVPLQSQEAMAVQAVYPSLYADQFAPAAEGKDNPSAAVGTSSHFLTGERVTTAFDPSTNTASSFSSSSSSVVAVAIKIGMVFSDDREKRSSFFNSCVWCRRILSITSSIC